MIEEKQKLSGDINATQELNGDINVATIVIPPSLQEKEVTPTTSSQEITADENYNGLSKVTISAVDSTIDSNIQSGNIKDGVSILGVTGNYKLDVYQYFYSSIEENGFGINKLIKSIPRFEMTRTNISGLSNQLYEYIDVSGINVSAVKSFDNAFYYCSNLKEIDLSSWDFGNALTARSMFSNCPSLTKIDIRTFEFSQMLATYRNSMFYNVPSNCLIIVKNQTEKNKVINDYGMTNVKTVAEYEN